MPTINNLFSLTFPDSWKETTVYTFEGPHDSGVQHNLVLVIDTNVPEKMGLKEYAKMQFGNNKEVLPGFALVNETEQRLPNGLQAYEILYKYAPTDDQVLFQKQVYMIIEEKGYIFTSTFSKKTLQTVGVEVDQIIANFKPLKVS
jgi:hypothetical protein